MCQLTSVRPNSQVHLAHKSNAGFFMVQTSESLQQPSNFYSFFQSIASNPFCTKEQNASSQGMILRKSFCRLKAFGGFTNQGSANYSPQARSTPSPVCVNEVLLKHSRALLLMYCPRLLSRYNSRVVVEFI